MLQLYSLLCKMSDQRVLSIKVERPGNERPVISLFIPFNTPAHGKTPLIFRVSLPTLVNSNQETPCLKDTSRGLSSR